MVEKIELSGCSQGTLSSKHGHDIATYTWKVDNPQGVIVCIHGLHDWTGYDYLSMNSKNERIQLEGSIIEAFLNAGFIVHCYDHPGHGQSSGIRAYFESFDVIRDISLEVCAEVKQEYEGIPLFLLGISMGATTCVLASIADSNLATGAVLLSPAVHTPSDMFGLYGTFLRAINRPLSKLIPKVKIIKLPLPADETNRNAFLNDPLNYTGPMRVRIGAEFIRVYQKFDKTKKFHFNNLLVIAGTEDKLVDPKAITNFFERSEADDKELIVHDNLPHEVLHDEDSKKVELEIVNWIKKIVDSSNNK